MPTRLRTQYVCQQCGRTAARELGRCPQCGAWNSMVGEAVAPPKPRRVGTPTVGGRRAPQRLAEIEGEAEARLALPIEEFARVLGGGIVPASVVLVGGEPGIGKSTLLLQVAVQMAHHGPVLYVSGEESERQIKARAQRLFGAQGVPDGLFLYSETDLESIIHHLESLQPILAVIDSIQTVYLPELDSSAGSITQVRDCASRLQAVAKAGGTAIFLVGHVTKEGAIAGPRVLEHIVDTVLYLEGDPFHAYRLLRSVKNRFGATSEVGVFEMGAGGMAEVPNPSEAFLAERVVNAPGSAIAVTMEGTRPLLVEVQGLTSPTSFGHPRRTANGVDLNRLLLTIAVLTRRVGLKLATGCVRQRGRRLAGRGAGGRPGDRRGHRVIGAQPACRSGSRAGGRDRPQRRAAQRRSAPAAAQRGGQARLHPRARAEDGRAQTRAPARRAGDTGRTHAARGSGDGAGGRGWGGGAGKLRSRGAGGRGAEEIFSLH